MPTALRKTRARRACAADAIGAQLTGPKDWPSTVAKRRSGIMAITALLTASSMQHSGTSERIASRRESRTTDARPAKEAGIKTALPAIAYIMPYECRGINKRKIADAMFWCAAWDRMDKKEQSYAGSQMATRKKLAFCGI